MGRHQWIPAPELEGWGTVKKHERQVCIKPGCCLVRVPSPSRSTDYYHRFGGDRMTTRPPCPFTDESQAPPICEDDCKCVSICLPTCTDAACLKAQGIKEDV